MTNPEGATPNLTLPEPLKHRLTQIGNFAIGIVGYVGTRVILIKRGVHYEDEAGGRNIAEINKTLEQDGHVLFVSDHPRTDETMYTIGFLAQRLKHRKHTGIIVREDLFTSNELGWKGPVLREALVRNKMKLLYVKTPAHTDKAQLPSSNFSSAREAIALLGKPGSSLLSFASGTRSPSMIEALKGTQVLPQYADLVVPLTTVNKSGEAPKIIVHKPIPGQTGIRWCTKHFGNNLGRLAFSDLAMTIIATGQPDEEKRGFYRDQCATLIPYTRMNKDELIQITDLSHITDKRIQNMVQAYIAWKTGEISSG